MWEMKEAIEILFFGQSIICDELFNLFPLQLVQKSL